jgi:hypothetical protein
MGSFRAADRGGCGTEPWPLSASNPMGGDSCREARWSEPRSSNGGSPQGIIQLRSISDFIGLFCPAPIGGTPSWREKPSSSRVARRSLPDSERPLSSESPGDRGGGTGVVPDAGGRPPSNSWTRNVALLHAARSEAVLRSGRARVDEEDRTDSAKRHWTGGIRGCSARDAERKRPMFLTGCSLFLPN